jgi:hypothetical protein
MSVAIGFGDNSPDHKAATARERAIPAKSESATPAGVPKGAVAISPVEYRFKDTKGKTWIYRQTPFGYSKSEEKAAGASTAGETPTPFGASVKAGPAAGQGAQAPNPFGSRDRAEPQAVIRAKEDGDSIRFEKSTPFGGLKWTRKKSELTAEEQEAWDRQTRTGSK